MPLVCVCTTLDLLEAEVIKSALEAYDIPTTLAGAEIAHQLDVLTNAIGGIRVLVSDVDAEEACKVISAARGCEPKV